jgi:hypothetical protein
MPTPPHCAHHHCTAAYSRVNAFGVARRSTSNQLLAADTEEASHRRGSTHRPLSADGDSANRQDSADRPARSPPVRCEYSNILMVPTSAPGLHVRGMGIATALAGHRRTRLLDRGETHVQGKPWFAGSIKIDVRAGRVVVPLRRINEGGSDDSIQYGSSPRESLRAVDGQCHCTCNRCRHQRASARLRIFDAQRVDGQRGRRHRFANYT